MGYSFRASCGTALVCEDHGMPYVSYRNNVGQNRTDVICLDKVVGHISVDPRTSRFVFLSGEFNDIAYDLAEKKLEDLKREIEATLVTNETRRLRGQRIAVLEDQARLFQSVCTLVEDCRCEMARAVGTLEELKACRSRARPCEPLLSSMGF